MATDHCTAGLEIWATGGSAHRQLWGRLPPTEHAKAQPEHHTGGFLTVEDQDAAVVLHHLTVI
jgi:hypothetical protein